MQDMLETIARALVDVPEAVQVRAMESASGRILYEIKVDAGDIGKIIGRQGRVIKAIRAVAKACAVRDGKRVMVELVE